MFYLVSIWINFGSNVTCLKHKAHQFCISSSGQTRSDGCGRGTRFGTKWVRLAPNETNLGFFKVIFKYIMYWKRIFKSHRFIPIRANLTHFGPNLQFVVCGSWKEVKVGQGLSDGWLVKVWGDNTSLPSVNYLTTG